MPLTLGLGRHRKKREILILLIAGTDDLGTRDQPRSQPVGLAPTRLPGTGPGRDLPAPEALADTVDDEYLVVVAMHMHRAAVAPDGRGVHQRERACRVRVRDADVVPRRCVYGVARSDPGGPPGAPRQRCLDLEQVDSAMDENVSHHRRLGKRWR
jgi:hypothetical protein